jgi:hypothetical protein
MTGVILLAAILLVLLVHNAVLYLVITRAVAAILAAIRAETGPQWTPLPDGITWPRPPDCDHKDRPAVFVHATGAAACHACATTASP